MQKNCPYCQFGNLDHGKDFLFQLGYKKEHMYITKYKNNFYISIVTNDIDDNVNGIQERSSHPITYCPMCGSSLTQKSKEENY